MITLADFLLMLARTSHCRLVKPRNFFFSTRAPRIFNIGQFGSAGGISNATSRCRRVEAVEQARSYAAELLTPLNSSYLRVSST